MSCFDYIIDIANLQNQISRAGPCIIFVSLENCPPCEQAESNLNLLKQNDIIPASVPVILCKLFSTDKMAIGKAIKLGITNFPTLVFAVNGTETIRLNNCEPSIVMSEIERLIS